MVHNPQKFNCFFGSLINTVHFIHQSSQ